MSDNNGVKPKMQIECPKCKTTEERVVANDKREVQDCMTCGAILKVKFPLGRQLDIETAPFKPFLDHASPAVQDLGEEWVTSRSRWRERVRYSKKMGFKEGHKGNGWGISKKQLEEAEARFKEKK